MSKTNLPRHIIFGARVFKMKIGFKLVFIIGISALCSSFRERRKENPPYLYDFLSHTRAPHSLNGGISCEFQKCKFQGYTSP